MDAVAFVLGEKTRAMRGAQLRDLLHVPAAAEGDEAPQPRSPCRVTLVFVAPGGDETHFTRAVTAAGARRRHVSTHVHSLARVRALICSPSQARASTASTAALCRTTRTTRGCRGAAC